MKSVSYCSLDISESQLRCFESFQFIFIPVTLRLIRRRRSKQTIQASLSAGRLQSPLKETKRTNNVTVSCCLIDIFKSQSSKFNSFKVSFLAVTLMFCVARIQTTLVLRP